MTANITYHGREDSFCDYSRGANFVRASKLRHSDYRDLVLVEATDEEVREAIFAAEDPDGRTANELEAIEGEADR